MSEKQVHCGIVLVIQRESKECKKMAAFSIHFSSRVSLIMTILPEQERFYVMKMPMNFKRYFLYRRTVPRWFHARLCQA